MIMFVITSKWYNEWHYGHMAIQMTNWNSADQDRESLILLGLSSMIPERHESITQSRYQSIKLSINQSGFEPLEFI